MRLDKFFIGVVILLIFLTGGILIIGEQEEKYDIGIDEDSESSFNNTKNLVTDLNKSVSGMRGVFDRKDEEIGKVEAFGFLLDAGTSAIRFLWTMISIPGDLAKDFYILLGLPAAMQGFFMIGLLVLLVFTFAFMYFRFQPR